MSAFSCEWCLLVFCRSRNEALEEFVTSRFYYPAWPGSGLCHLVSCVTPSLVSPLPSYSLGFLLQQQRDHRLAIFCFSSLTSSGDPSIPSKALELSRALCKRSSLLANPKKGVTKREYGFLCKAVNFHCGVKSHRVYGLNL